MTPTPPARQAMSPAPPPVSPSLPPAVPIGRDVAADGVTWHLTHWPGDGPAWLLLHGTAASHGSWQGLVGALRRQGCNASIWAPDLPGHGRSARLPAGRGGMVRMAAALAELLALQGVRPAVVLGHSAGAALMLRLALDRGWPAGCRLVGLNAALQPFEGLAAWAYPALARVLAPQPLVPWLLARQARRPAALRRMLAATGSQLDEGGQALHARWLQDPQHLAGVLAMVADWDLPGLQRDLPRLAQPLWLLAGERDAVVPPAQARQVARRLPGCTLSLLPGLGHLMHEEAPDRVAEVLAPLLDAGLTPKAAAR